MCVAARNPVLAPIDEALGAKARRRTKLLPQISRVAHIGNCKRYSPRRQASLSFQQIRRRDDEVEETTVLNRLRQLPLVDQDRAL